ncbi:MAG TPA: phytanoyl-CoA dioxygenase family protein [Chloroflexota bacterium]|nr:phytanoyl-CoA dioxygenase family protein [Chloroflexota bacterium]
MAISTAPITDEQIQSFARDGFIKIDNALSPEEVAEFRAALIETSEKHRHDYTFNKGDQYTQHVNVWTVHPGVRRQVFNPKLAEIARLLSQSARVRIWHDQWIVKMPGDRPSRWHQDLTLWPMIESGPLTCWIALVDVPVEMGCMHFIPGSHRWGRFACGTLPNTTLETLDGVRLLVPEDKHDQLRPVVVPLKAGSCTFHNCLTLHYAGPNQTDQERLGFIVNYMPGRITFSGKKHVTTDPLNLAEGQPLEGDLFPILASENPTEVVHA